MTNHTSQCRISKAGSTPVVQSAGPPLGAPQEANGGHRWVATVDLTTPLLGTTRASTTYRAPSLRLRSTSSTPMSSRASPFTLRDSTPPTLLLFRLLVCVVGTEVVQGSSSSSPISTVVMVRRCKAHPHTFLPSGIRVRAVSSPSSNKDNSHTSAIAHSPRQALHGSRRSVSSFPARRTRALRPSINKAKWTELGKMFRMCRPFRPNT